MKSTVTFKQFFYENMTAGSVQGGSPGGFSPDNITDSDFYNTGSTVIAKPLGVFTRSGKLKNKRNKRRKKKAKK